MVNYLKYFAFIGTYIVIFKFFEIIPIQIDVLYGVGLALIGMIIVFILLLRGKNFDIYSFYKASLLFTFVFCVVTILLNQSPGVTETANNGILYYHEMNIYDQPSFINHGLLGGALILLTYSIIKLKLKLIAFGLANIVSLFVYLVIVLYQ